MVVKARMRKATATRGEREQTNVPDVEQALRNNEKHRARRGKMYGTPTDDTDPAEVLLKEIRRTAGHIEWIREQLRWSDPERFVESMWLTRRQSGYVAPKEFDPSDWSAAGALWVELYLNERKHLAAICRTALAAGIEERRI